MNLGTAELHVRAIVGDVLIESAAEPLVGDEQWLDREINEVIHEVSEAQGGDVNDFNAQARGLENYAVNLRARLAQQFPESVKRARE